MIRKAFGTRIKPVSGHLKEVGRAHRRSLQGEPAARQSALPSSRGGGAAGSLAAPPAFPPLPTSCPFLTGGVVGQLCDHHSAEDWS